MRALLVALALAATPASTTVYREVTGASSSLHTFTVSPTPDGHAIRVTREGGPYHAVETFELDGAWNTVAWTHVDERRGTRLEARRTGEVIVLEGTFEGDAVKKDFDVGTQAWHQAMPVDLEPFVRSGQESFRYWAIGLSGPAALKIATFEATREGTSRMPVQGSPTEVVRIRLSLTGLLRPFWSADYWFRASDAKWLRFEGKTAHGEGTIVLESQPRK